jgi:hypothetical protein
MNSVYALVYFEACIGTPNLVNVTNGPFLFQTEQAAQEALLVYIRNRFVEAYIDELAEGVAAHDVDICEYTEDNDSPMTVDEAHNMLMHEQAKLNFNTLVPWYSEIANDEQVYFGYKLEQLPTSSFIELVHEADAIEINYDFFRHFHITSVDELDSDTSIFIDAADCNEDGEKFEYYISLTEAQNATYCFMTNTWLVGDLNVVLVNYATKK